MELFILIINACILMGIVLSGYKYSKRSALISFYFPTVALKIVAGIGVGLVFKHYYESGDTINYFEEGVRFADVARENTWLYFQKLIGFSDFSFESRYYNQPRALLFSKVTSVLALITANNYWIISVYYSLFSFFGLWSLAVRLDTIFKNRLAIVVSLLFIPSVVFWSAGITKESIATGCLAYIVSIFVGFVYQYQKFKFVNLFLALSAFILLWKIKYYYAGVLALVMIAASIVCFIIYSVEKVKKSSALQFLLFCFFCGTMFLVVSLTNPNFNIDRMAGVIYYNHEAFVVKSRVDQVIQFDDLQPTWFSVLDNAPVAIISGLFRPVFGDGVYGINIFSQIENIFIILLFISSLPGFLKIRARRTRIIVLATLVYCIGLAGFLALSAPNFGTLVRYKVGFLPFFILLITLPNPLIKNLNKRLFNH